MYTIWQRRIDYRETCRDLLRHVLEKNIDYTKSNKVAAACEIVNVAFFVLNYIDVIARHVK